MDVRQRTVLIVDDDRDLAESMAMLLSCLGYDCVTEHSGKAAIETAAHASFETVVLDIDLGDITGFDVARAIRSQVDHPQPHLIALTGSDREDYRTEAVAAGFDCFALKPIDAAELQSLLRTTASVASSRP